MQCRRNLERTFLSVPTPLRAHHPPHCTAPSPAGCLLQRNLPPVGTCHTQTNTKRPFAASHSRKLLPHDIQTLERDLDVASNLESSV